jgi:hypothetical protein
MMQTVNSHKLKFPVEMTSHPPLIVNKDCINSPILHGFKDFSKKGISPNSYFQWLRNAMLTLFSLPSKATRLL